MTQSSELYRIPVGSRSISMGIFLEILAVVLGALIILFWGTTQWMARKLGFANALEPELWFQVPSGGRWVFGVLGAFACASAFLPWVRSTLGRKSIVLVLIGGSILFVGMQPVYQPFAFVWWAIRFRSIESIQPLIETGIWVISVPAHFLVLASVIVAIRRARQVNGPSDTHGSADFAEAKDVEACGLFARNGVVLGGFQNKGHYRYLKHDGSEHCLVFAPSRSGKGTSIVIPTLLSWADSCVVFDPKGENWNRTAGWRKHELGSLCVQLNPVDSSGNSARWNPLQEIQRGEREVRDAQQIAEILTSGEMGSEDPHWRTTAADLLTGVILHCLYAERDKTLPGVLELLSDPRRSVEATLQEMLETQHDPAGEEGWVDRLSGEQSLTHPVVASVARTMLNRSENERSSVLSTAVRCLSLWRDFGVAKNGTKSDFTMSDLLSKKQPMSIYLTVPVSDLSRTRPFTRLFFALALRRLTEQLESMHNADRPRRVLLVLDEFPQLHHIPEFESALSVISGFGIQALIVTQDLMQIYKYYGRNQGIVGNCDVLVTFRTPNIDTAKLVSEMAGTRTVRRQRHTYTGNRLSPWLGHVMASEQESQRPLISPDEVTRLPEDATLVFAGGKPIQGTKTPYFKDVEFRRRALIPPPQQSDRLAVLGQNWPEVAIRPSDKAQIETLSDVDAEDQVDVEPFELSSTPS